MSMLSFLVLFPFLVAFIMMLMKKGSLVRRYTLYICCGLIVIADLIFAIRTLRTGETLSYFTETLAIDRIMLIAEWGLVALVFYFSFKFRKYYCALLSVVQTGMVTVLELTGKTEIPGAHMMVDRLTIIMCLIVGIVGCLICVFAMGYMRDYAKHHVEFKDRRSFFFAMLFVFLGAMFGLVLSNNMMWMYFFWEITSICSFLLIGYNQTEEAMNNSFKALWMNLLGGLGFAVAICYSVMNLQIINLQDLVNYAISENPTAVMALVPVAFLAFAGLTKSAQLPFSGWLLGAMVAPTPTSALLHSATMVKAGVYLLLRLAPAMAGTTVGIMITTIGGFTFFAASMLAISHSDGKRVLAYSTISNLGLITACAGVGLPEAVWAGVLLMMFHAVSKSLMFLTVGAVENCLGSRNVEDMHGLIIKLPGLAYILIIGIAGMFLAPFGMLVSKWAALKAFVDSNSVLLVLFLVFGSATTLFYWTKWLGSLIAVHSHSERIENVTKKIEWFALIALATIMVGLCVTFPLASTYLIEPFLMGMFNETVPNMIGTGNLYIMIMMLIMICILPVMARILTFGKKHELGLSYMGGINTGDNRKFVDSYGEPKQMYLSNWYVKEYFGDDKILKISLAFSTTVIIVFLLLTIGGALL